MATSLRPCPGCSRHVRASEPACPFCGGDLGDAFRSVPGPRVPAVGRLSRAALFAIGAGGLTVGSGCGSLSQAMYGTVVMECEPDGASSDCVVPYVRADASVAPGVDGAVDAAVGDAMADVESNPMTVIGAYGCAPSECSPGLQDAGSDATATDAASVNGITTDAATDASPEGSTVADAGKFDAGTFLLFYGAPPH
jgi:hypothetical protein